MESFEVWLFITFKVYFVHREQRRGLNQGKIQIQGRIQIRGRKALSTTILTKRKFKEEATSL